MEKQIEFLVCRKETGEILYRYRRTIELDRSCFPEKYFEPFMNQVISLFRHSDEEKYKDCVVQMSCFPSKHTTHGVLFDV